MIAAASRSPIEKDGARPTWPANGGSTRFQCRNVSSERPMVSRSWPTVNFTGLVPVSTGVNPEFSVIRAASMFYFCSWGNPRVTKKGPNAPLRTARALGGTSPFLNGTRAATAQASATKSKETSEIQARLRERCCRHRPFGKRAQQKPASLLHRQRHADRRH